MERVDAAIIGGGVTGLAAALTIAERGITTCLLERHPRPGLETSTHNSGVIHAGIYYPTDTLKARLCVEGRRMLYRFCATHGVPHARTSKIIVANTDKEIAALSTLHARGTENGVERLELVDADFISAREPHVRGMAALYSPESGIVDADALVKTLLRKAGIVGAIILPSTQLLGAELSRDGMTLRTERETILARQVVNAAGLHADDVSRLIGGEDFTVYPCRGEYAQLARTARSLVSSLVYPLPEPTGYGLGVHLIPTTDGAVRLGPTARYQTRKDDYESDRVPVEAFLEPARRLLREIGIADLRLSDAGIRPTLHPAGEPLADFLIRRDRQNPAVIQAAGIDSPGLTACLAIGRVVAQLIEEGR